jgi:hypothetical protein
VRAGVSLRATRLVGPSASVQLALMGAEHERDAAQHIVYAPPEAILAGSVVSETKSRGLLPCELNEPSPFELLHEAGLGVLPLPAVVTDLPALRARFHSDEHYRDMVRGQSALMREESDVGTTNTRNFPPYHIRCTACLDIS